MARGVLLQQPGHALQVVLDAVVHFLDQHLALRDRRLEARLLPRRAARSRRWPPAAPARARRRWLGSDTKRVSQSARAGRAVQRASRGAVTSLRRERRAQVGTQRLGRPRRRTSRRGVRADQLLGRPAEEGRRHLVDLQHAQRARVEQRDRQRRGLDDALQRGLRLRDADLGLAAPLDVEQREGELRGRWSRAR